MKLLDKMKGFREEYLEEYINYKNSQFLKHRIYEHEPDLRTEYQRDRDRIIHSRAFRRLSGKTQIFNSSKGDHYRTRLTHSLEVSQIGRTIGKIFELDNDLIEAIALGHDLGHTPFGHVIERTLNDILKNNEIENIKIKVSDGFKHNFQSLHLVDNLEMGNRNKRGLNLTLAVRDGILKHTDIFQKSDKITGKEIIIYEDIHLECDGIELMNYSYPITLEGQIVALADEIAQSTHDLEDGVRSKIISINDLRSDFKEELCRVANKIDKIGSDNFDKVQFEKFRSRLLVWIDLTSQEDYIDDLTIDINNLISILIDSFIRDAIENSRKNIKETDAMFDKQNILAESFINNSRFVEKFRNFVSDYIYSNVVSSQEVSQSDSKAKYIIKQIFKAYYEDPRQLPDYSLIRYFGDQLDRKKIMQQKSNLQEDPKFIRIICDHISGMTDNFAIEEYNNLYGIIYNP